MRSHLPTRGGVPPLPHGFVVPPAANHSGLRPVSAAGSLRNSPARLCRCLALCAACCSPPALATSAGRAVREVAAADAPAELKRWPDIFVEGFPVVFRGLVAGSPLLRAFSHENLARYADTIGGWSLNKGHGSGPWNAHAYEGGHWSLRQVLDYYEGRDGAADPALQCFKSQGHLPAQELVQPVVDAVPRRLLQTVHVDRVHWWMGVNGSTVVTALHMDNYHNFFFATHGAGGKKFILYPPWDADNLHVWDKNWLYSEVLLDLYAKVNKTPAQLEELWKEPSLEKYPNVAKAERYDVVLFPGDALYIPMRWWHSGLNIGDVIGVNSWFYVPNPFANLFDQFFSQTQKPQVTQENPEKWPKLAKLPKKYASLKALPPPAKTPPMGVHPDMVRMRIGQRQKQLGCVRAQVRPFKKVFAELKQFREELTCLQGIMRGIWQAEAERITGDYRGGSAELWRRVTEDPGRTLYCPRDSPTEHIAGFERFLQLRNGGGKFSLTDLLENAYLGCATKGTCLAVHQALGRALRSAVVWGKCKGDARGPEL